MEDFGYEKLEVWQVAMELVDCVYEHTRPFPREELFGLVSQMRASSASIPANIAEGYGNGNKMFARHLRIARGSSFELRTQIEIARRQSFVETQTAVDLKQRTVQIGKMLTGLLRSIEADPD